jgi:hypothetical protein
MINSSNKFKKNSSEFLAIKNFLSFTSLIIAFLILSVFFPHGMVAVTICAIISIFTITVIHQSKIDEKIFLVNVFLVALLIRVVLGTVIYAYDLQGVFGPDAETYDIAGVRISRYWLGELPANIYGLDRAMSFTNPSWGMNYLVAIVYYALGRNEIAVQFICCAIGAATVPAIYFCSHKIFNNVRAAKTAALIVAVFPSMLIWSSQMLKDGLIIFLLVMAMIAVINLQEKLSTVAIITLVLSLFGILSLRFYIFFMVAAAVIGSFIVGASKSNQSVVKRLAALLIIGVGLTYLGGVQTASENFDRYGNIETLQISRADQARAGSGYAEDADITTVQGAIWVLPIGFIYLMFAPFPWDVSSVSKAIIVPETLVWWASMPLLLSGLVYTIRKRFRTAIPILIFTLMLTLAYSIFQGNVGTAYRQRTQIQVFLFVFIGVGWTLRKEEAENKALAQNLRRLKKAY